MMENKFYSKPKSKWAFDILIDAYGFLKRYGLHGKAFTDETPVYGHDSTDHKTLNILTALNRAAFGVVKTEKSHFLSPQFRTARPSEDRSNNLQAHIAACRFLNTAVEQLSFSEQLQHKYKRPVGKSLSFEFLENFSKEPSQEDTDKVFMFALLEAQRMLMVKTVNGSNIRKAYFKKLARLPFSLRSKIAPGINQTNYLDYAKKVEANIVDEYDPFETLRVR